MKNIIKSLLNIIIAILCLYFIKIIYDLHIFPTMYFIIVLLIILVLYIIGTSCLYIKRKRIKIVSCICFTLLIIISIIGINYGNVTLKFLNKSFNNNKTTLKTSYGVLVLKDSNLKELNNLNEKSLGYLIIDDYSESLEKVVRKVNTINSAYDDMYLLYDSLANKEEDAILLDMAYYEILSEEKNINENINIIYTFDIEKENINNSNKIITSLEPFNIYISGSDSRSKDIKNKSLSDVNMILTINPHTNKMLVTSIPRDYYVNIHGKVGIPDKLTHTGIYGVDVSRETLEDLFDIDINYSIKVNMSSLVEVVDLVGGIDINSDKKFKSSHIKGWIVKKGINHMDGKHALAYARERYAYKDGDRHRILNQQQVLEAVLNKVMSDKTILFKYEKLLNSLSNMYQTDIPKDVVTYLGKEQIEEMAKWTISRNSVSGRDASKKTYSAPKSKRYVMIPNEKDIKDAHNLIMEVLEGGN